MLVLFVVGEVNPRRIGTFKRTNRYSIDDFNLLLSVFKQFRWVYTLPHILAEVSNLTDLAGPEQTAARSVLKSFILVIDELACPSRDAASDPIYDTLGLTDAAIGAAARLYRCSVLTDDLPLFVRLTRDKIPVLNFSHLRARAGRR
jgi:hypothetical protein